MSIEYIEVVTRRGRVRHLAEKNTDAWTISWREFTLCLGTSAWTIPSWELVPDHPTLTVAEMKELPPCRKCKNKRQKLQK